jgi:CheY-like chemotaxis protein
MDGNPQASILIVDDDRASIVAVQEILSRLGARLVAASSGEEALRCVLEDDFAAIVMDVKMPGIDGFTTAKMIRERKRSRYTPIIFLTAESQADLTPMFRGYQAGAVDYITKPFDPWVLRSKVAVFVDLYRLHTEVTERAAELDALRKIVDEALELLHAAEPTDAAASTLVDRLRGVLGMVRRDQRW